MSFVSIDSNTIKVGDPITKDILDLIKDNFDNHELRINSLATTGGTVFIFNGDVNFSGYSTSNPNIFYYKARQDFSINDFRVQLFSKQGISSGTLSLDLQKSSLSTNDSSFSSVLSSALTIDFSTDPDFTHVESASINPSSNDILTDNIIRVRILSIPSGFSGLILMSIGAQ